METEYFFALLQDGALVAAVAALLWVGKMAWHASHTVASHAARIMALEEAVRQINESCKLQREDVKDFQKEQNDDIAEMKTMLAVQGNRIENMEKQNSEILRRLSRRATDRED